MTFDNLTMHLSCGLANVDTMQVFSALLSRMPVNNYHTLIPIHNFFLQISQTDYNTCQLGGLKLHTVGFKSAMSMFANGRSIRIPKVGLLAVRNSA